MSDEDTQGKINAPNYYKTEEHTTKTYEEAEVIANKLYEPYLAAESSDGRTCTDAKVRIRCKTARNSLRDTFRVILYKSIKSAKKKDVPEIAVADDTEGESEVKSTKAKGKGSKKKRQQRGDKRG